MPKRIQRKRTKGWRMPEGAVYVGRPTKWGNPWIVRSDTGEQLRRLTVDQYQTYLELQIEHGELDLAELRGKDLACWCRLDQPCHADILLELANA